MLLNLCIFTTNAAGIKNKIHSLKNELNHLGCGIFTLQESHLKKKGKITIDGWELFEAMRKKEFGGTMIRVNKALDPVLIEEYCDEFELLVVEANIGDKDVRIISGYGPQETWKTEDKLPF